MSQLPTFTIKTGSRLHFGPLSYHPETGRHFGGIGLMLKQPGVQLIARRSESGNQLHNPSPEVARRFQSIIEQTGWVQNAVDLKVISEIPSHCGLGSGTQLSLAIADAVARVNGKELNATELARLIGRGERSAIGLLGYDQGGFLIDAGRKSQTDIGALAARVPFPEEWKILLVRSIGDRGISGDLELSAFQKLPPMSERLTGKLCRLALTEILPALLQKDFASFTAALYEYGFEVGTFFSATQNGVFSSTAIQTLASEIHAEKVGMAQSSWGPATALFAENEDEACELRHRINSSRMADRLTTEAVEPLNHGRELLVHNDPIA